MVIPIKLPREEKEELIARLQAYFEDERSESIGSLAAEQLLDFMIQELGPYLYNKGVADARILLNGKLAQLEDELYVLEKPVCR